ncbi:hypothetical protein NKR19_g4700 [Coniochaeta hoffmannii]|uniref:Protein kinase domain-containing protein n=1 Tax=Coniochaeta hoffmannii TaxID=91930 RepID=A0AA38VMM1_9PEZI|nr:hypothetical protein NKR19_g4700 [Coniochaeta hoffmannii]
MISRSHHRFSDSKTNNRYSVAIKTVTPPTKSFKDKKPLTKALRVLDVYNPHIVVLLAEIFQSRVHRLVFPWPQGTLRDLWAMRGDKIAKDFKLERGSLELKRWFFEQCLGLAKALLQMHKLSYAHGRIRPENIFWYYEKYLLAPRLLGSLKIFDDVVDAIPANKEALENDVWALGCVFLEFIAWYIRGPGAVDTPEPNQVVPQDPAPDKMFMQLSTLRSGWFAGPKELLVIDLLKEKYDEVISYGRSEQDLRMFLEFILDSMVTPPGSKPAECDAIVRALAQLTSDI